MADGKIEIETKIDDSGIDKGVKGVSKKLQSIGNSSTLKGLANIGATVSGIGVAFKVVTNAIGKASAAVKEYIDLANKQIKSETQLEAAAKNNPYLNKENVKQLKNFASQLQSIGTIGDEELLPLMAQLAAAGRTQAEIQDIMSAALDVSASGAMSMESAVKNLNKTFSGLSGELGESIPQIKSLTQEQLKNGEAVKVVANQYKGMAEETTKASGTGIQLKNAIGDLKEQLGMGWAAITRPVNTLFTNLITKVGNAIGKVNELLGFAHEQSTSTLSESDIIAENLTDLRTKREVVYKELLQQQTEYDKAVLEEQKNGIDEQKKANQEYFDEAISTRIENAKKSKEEYTKILQDLETQVSNSQNRINILEQKLAVAGISRQQKSALESEIKKEQKNIKRITNSVQKEFAEQELERAENLIQAYEHQAKTEATTSAGFKQNIDRLQKDLDAIDEQIKSSQKQYNDLKSQEKVSPEDKAAAELIKKNTDAYYAQIDAIDKRANALAKMGTPMSELEIQQEKLSVAEQSYIDLVTTDTSLVTTENQAAKTRLQNVTDLVTKVNELQATTDKTNLVLKWSKEGEDATDELKETKAALVQMKNLIESNQLVLPGIDITEIDKAIENINKKIEEGGKTTFEKFQEIARNIGTVMDSVSSGLSNVDQYFDQYANTQLSAIQNEADNEAEDLKTQYENGIISYEEYLDKKDELDKKAAQKEYKIKLAQWQMDMAVATVNAAQATLNALASGTPPTNILNAVAAGLLGAAQVATVAANKPTAPSFATGGFLTGNSTQGDKIPFKGNAGEAILNASEQRNFMRYANGEAEGQGINITMPINITNNASNDTEVSVARQERQIQITIDKAVNAGFKNGTYTDSMSYAQSNKTGRKYL